MIEVGLAPIVTVPQVSAAKSRDRELEKYRQRLRRVDKVVARPARGPDTDG